MTLFCKDLTNYVTIDDEDYEELAQYNGRLSFNRVTGAYFCEKRQNIYVHRHVMGKVFDIDGKQVCFVNGDRLDCRKQNLFTFDPAVDPPDLKRRVRKERKNSS